MKRDPQTAPVTPKLKALLTIAGQVQEGGKRVTAADVERARAEGATDLEIHDTVLIAAAFCMYNRYVDGLATVTPSDPAGTTRWAGAWPTTATSAPAGELAPRYCTVIVTIVGPVNAIVCPSRDR